MAHGLPDFYRGVDIAYQALAEMIIRPKYGAAQLAAGTKVVTANDWTSLFTVYGKGMVYGGTVIVQPALTQENSVVTILCDAVSLNNMSFLVLDDFNVKVAYSNAIYSLKYDLVNLEFSVAVSPYLTFETSLSCSYYEAHGNTPTIYYRIFYALI